MTKKILFLGLLLAGFTNICFSADYLEKTAYYGLKGLYIFASTQHNYMDVHRKSEDLIPNVQLLITGLRRSNKIVSREGLLALANGSKIEMVYLSIPSVIFSQSHPISLEVAKRSQSMLKYSSWYTPEMSETCWRDDAGAHPEALIRKVAEPIVFELFKSGLEKASETDMGKSIMQNIPEEYQSAALEHGTFILASAGARVIGVVARQALEKKNLGFRRESISEAANNFKKDTFVYVGGNIAEHCIIRPGIEKYVDPLLKQYISPTIEQYTGLKDSDWYLKNGLNFAANYFVYTNLNSAVKDFKKHSKG